MIYESTKHEHGPKYNVVQTSPSFFQLSIILGLYISIFSFQSSSVLFCSEITPVRHLFPTTMIETYAFFEYVP